MACEVVAETKEPLSRQSVADLVRRARAALGKNISRSTVWRTLHHAAIKPWQHEHWIFPRDPRFAEKAGPILDLYAGTWEDKPLGPKDYVLCMDEKTSIQARGRCHEEMPPEPKQSRRIEKEYDRNGALQYLAAWDVHRGMVLGRCEPKTGIKPYGRMVDQVLEQEPYHDADRLFFVVDNGSSHRGQTSVGGSVGATKGSSWCTPRFTCVTADAFAFPGFGAMAAHHDARSASWRTSNSHGQYLSTDKINQTSPD